MPVVSLALFQLRQQVGEFARGFGLGPFHLAALSSRASSSSCSATRASTQRSFARAQSRSRFVASMAEILFFFPRQAHPKASEKLGGLRNAG